IAEGAVLGALDPSSGAGYTRDRRVKPEVVASGYGVGAARSAQSSIDSYYVLPDGVHAVRSGTSAGAAHVAGAAALVFQEQLLQQKPQRTVNDLRQILTERARSDTFTGPVPNPDWGYGKLNLIAGVTPSATNSTVPPVIVGDSSGNPILGGYQVIV